MVSSVCAQKQLANMEDERLLFAFYFRILFCNKCIYIIREELISPPDVTMPATPS